MQNTKPADTDTCFWKRRLFGSEPSSVMGEPNKSIPSHPPNYNCVSSKSEKETTPILKALSSPRDNVPVVDLPPERAKRPMGFGGSVERIMQQTTPRRGSSTMQRNLLNIAW
eukprot:GHVS01073123.1.p1 GENE.GHVS01073123.1~~GHVS01073123.1.p1  ORF type:complete len:112 (-),score=10.08 GHVS01073123.1:5-340(-)